ncbi:ras guanine nucleotide exchange factor domain-containing protein [Sporodiniella umbellata]|nr:ras guanine nucleotide exchange factor domain-containing protein [Sporodiniella umbellata]
MSIRKRSNSIIPIEFMKDETSGGMERAALATVFGVKEYTESKIFWNHDDITLKPKESLSLPLIPAVSEFGDFWQDQPTKNPLQPLDLSKYPPALFDIIQSDENNPCITWQRVSCHYPLHETNKKRSRWSTELFFKKQAHVVQQREEKEEIETATLEKLIEKLTVSLDYPLMTDFFLIYRIFTTPVQLLNYLMLRYKWSLEKESQERHIVRIRTFVIVRHWLLNYFLHDFVPDKQLRSTLTQFLNDMALEPVIKCSLRDQRIIQSLKRVVQRLKKVYYVSPMPVQIIEPPPPTFEQERVAAIIKNSLSKSTLRQRMHGIHVDARHGANTAVRDQKTAPVLVIGNPPYVTAFHSPQRSLQHSKSSLPLPSIVPDKTIDRKESFETDLTPGNSDAEEEWEEKSTETLEQPISAANVPWQEPKRSFYCAQLASPLWPDSSSGSMQSEWHSPASKNATDRINKPLPALCVDDSRWQTSMPSGNVKDSLGSEKWKASIQNRASDRSRVTEIDRPPPSVLSTNYASILLNYPTSVIVEQFCLIEQEVLLDIDWEELVDIRWTKMPAAHYLHYELHIGNAIHDDQIGNGYIRNSAPGIYSRTRRMKQQQARAQDGSERGIEKSIHRFNAVCQWVTSEIVQTESLEMRVRLIEKFIRLAKKCKLYCNFSTLIQILLGLQSSAVSRLARTWALVHKREMKILRKLSTFTSPTKNWKYLRDSMTQVAEEYGESPTEIQVEKLNRSKMTIKLPFGGCIPFLGIYLSDLVFNTELPSYIASEYNPKKGQGGILEKTVMSQPLVHLRKHRITASVIKKVLLFQGLAKRYSFVKSTNNALYSACLQVVSLHTSDMQERSQLIEPS